MRSSSPSPFPWAPVFLLTGIFYFNFTSRVILAPLLPVIEQELRLGHGGAGDLFLYVAIGYAPGMLASGFVTSRLSHRLTIGWAILMVGAALLAISFSTSVNGMRVCLVIIGIFAGFYIPSGIATLTELASREQWGKALSVHELAPNLGFVTVPLLAEGLLKFISWRGTLAVLGAACIFMGVLFFLRGRGGDQRGLAPSGAAMRKILASPAYWMMCAFFSLSIGSSIGLYSMIPLYLVNEVGMERTLANPLMGFSRVFAVIILFCSGFIMARFGAKRAMTFFLLTTGVLTLLFGFLHNTLGVTLLMFFQAASVACLFPVGLTALSLAFPSEVRPVAVSLVMLVGSSVGGGVVPSGLGHWAEAFSFSSGFAVLGILFLLLLPLFLRLGNHLEV